MASERIVARVFVGASGKRNGCGSSATMRFSRDFSDLHARGAGSDRRTSTAVPNFLPGSSRRILTQGRKDAETQTRIFLCIFASLRLCVFALKSLFSGTRARRRRIQGQTWGTRYEGPRRGPQGRKGRKREGVGAVTPRPSGAPWNHRFSRTPQSPCAPCVPLAPLRSLSWPSATGRVAPRVCRSPGNPAFSRVAEEPHPNLQGCPAR